MKIHLDIDCFFVSAERTRYPFLKGKNVVVVKGSDNRIFSNEKKKAVVSNGDGAFNSILEFKNSYNSNDIINQWKKEFIDDNGDIHGIVIAKSYECKPYGIKTGTSLRDAIHMCPNLFIIPSDHLFYTELSEKLKSYLELKIPIIEFYSIDEVFGDITNWIKDSDVLNFITELRDEISEKFDLPVTIAASKSKWIAKLVTDRVKPFGVYVLPEENVLEYTKDILIEDFPGVGKAIYKRLNSLKIKTLGELRNRPHLLSAYGRMGKDLYNRISGTDNEKVVPNWDRKGIGISRNFKAISSRDEIFRRVSILARYLSHTIVKLNLNPTTFYFKIRYEYGVKNSQSITENRLFNERFLIDLANTMIKKLDNHPGYKIHYIAISASNFTSIHNQKTLSLLDHETDSKFAALNSKLLKIRDKYGIDAIKYGSEFCKE